MKEFRFPWRPCIRTSRLSRLAPMCGVEASTRLFTSTLAWKLLCRGKSTVKRSVAVGGGAGGGGGRNVAADQRERASTLLHALWSARGTARDRRMAKAPDIDVPSSPPHSSCLAKTLLFINL